MGDSAPRSTEPGLPRLIGRYEAFLQIGSGGMARVYLAVDRGALGTGDDLVVVKILRREGQDDERVHASFIDEAWIAMRLQHPNVIRTRDAVAEPPDYLLAMEYLAGQSLLQLLRRVGRASMPLDEHLFILTQVLAGLTYAHELRGEDGRPLGIVHRDVSPSNVLVSYGGEIKLLDFGIAEATGALAASRYRIVEGKLGYAAPEQCAGNGADPRSDVYAVGVMLWEAIAGRRRSSGQTWQSVLHGRIEDRELAIDDACPGVPLALSRIVHRALSHSPGERYPSARKFREALEAYLASRRVSVGPERIAALLRPHFDRDRAQQRTAIEAYLSQRRRMVSGTRRLVPPALAAEIASAADEEDTSPIPVDDALLLQSMRDSVPGLSYLPVTANEPAANSLPPESGSVAAPLFASLPDAASASSTAADESSERVTSPFLKVSGTGAVTSGEPAVRWDAEEPPPFRKHRLRRPALLAMGAALAGVVALLVSASRRGATEAHGTAATAASGHPEIGRGVGATPSATPAPASGVKLRILVTPLGAAVRLDGRLLSANPFVATFPKDDAEHDLRASAPGFHEKKQLIRFDQDLDLEVSLQPWAGAWRGHASAHAAPPAAAPRVSPESHAAPPGVEPGMDLQPRSSQGRGKRTIDEKDPYGP